MDESRTNSACRLRLDPCAATRRSATASSTFYSRRTTRTGTNKARNSKGPYSTKLKAACSPGCVPVAQTSSREIIREDVNAADLTVLPRTEIRGCVEQSENENTRAQKNDAAKITPCHPVHGAAISRRILNHICIARECSTTPKLVSAIKNWMRGTEARLRHEEYSHGARASQPLSGSVIRGGYEYRKTLRGSLNSRRR